MRSLWAAGMLLRRMRDELGFGLLIVVLVAATTFVFAAGPRLFNRVADDALRHVAQVAAPSQRNVALVLADSLGPGRDGGVSGVRGFGEGIAKTFPASVTALFADTSLRITTVRFVVPNPPALETHVTLRYQDGFTDATQLVSGRWPRSRNIPLRVTIPGTGQEPPTEPAVFETALSTAEATEIGVKLGDLLRVELDGSDALLRRTPYKLGPTQFEIVGLYTALDPTAEYWRGDTDLIQPVLGGTEDEPIAFVTAYIPAETYPGLWSSQLPFHYDWRYRVDPQRLDAGQVPQLQVDLRRLVRITSPTNETTGAGAQVVTGLPKILDRYAAELALSEAVLSIAAIGPFGLAAGAMAMVALLLVRRRRAALALTRGRGASGALVLGTQLWEAILLAGAAGLAGFLVAVVVIPARESPLSAALALAVVAVAVLLLVVASLPAARRPLGILERDDPPLLRVAPRRLVIEMTIVAIAVAAALLLRQRGLTFGAASAADGIARVDPLLASVPVLSGVAAGILALRLYPLPIRGLAWLAARRRDIVPVLGLRTIGRHPAAANLPLLVLLLTAAFGAFASVVVASLDRGQLAASYLDLGADYTVSSVGDGSLPVTVDPAAITGVEAVAPGFTDAFAGFISTANRRSSIYLEAIDPGAYDAVLAGTPIDAQWPFEFLAAPVGDDIGTDENPIPAILSATLPVGTAALAPGDTFRLTVYGQPMTFQLVEQRASFPGIAARVPFAVAPFNWVRAGAGARLLNPTVLWLRAPAGIAEPLATALKDTAGGARIASRYGLYAKLHDAPLSAAVTAGYALAVIIAAIYMAITVVGALVLSAARRTQDLAYLRTLGVTARQSLALTIVEHGPPVLLAVVPGVLLGIGVAILCQPGLGLAAFVGTSEVPLFVDWPRLLLLVAALVAVVVAAVTIGTWLARRARLVDALRIGEH